MLSGKKGKGRGNGSPKKTESSTTRGKKKDLSVSLVFVSSMVKTQSNPKNLSAVSKGRKLSPMYNDTNTQKQTAVKSPKQEQQTIAQVVTATK